MSSKRDRYERANMRGGLGVRKKLSEESLRPTYRLNGVRSGFAVARCHDKYGRWEGGYTLGIIVRLTSTHVQVRWLGSEDISTYQQGDARYEVDRGRWKILGALQGNPLDPTNPIVDALTNLLQSAKMPVCEPVESVKKQSQNQSSSNTPMAPASRLSVEDVRESTNENTGESNEAKKGRQRVKSSAEFDASTESKLAKSKLSGKRKGNAAQSAENGVNPSLTIVTSPSSGEASFVENVTLDSDSSKTAPIYSEQQQHTSNKQLTREAKSHRVPASASPDDPAPTTDGVDETEEDRDMAREMSNAAAERAAAKKALANGDLKDRETYTAKQVATRLGTDAKTMRKFFRSNHSTVEPVGQGGRYEFAATDFPQIKREFEAWRSKASSRSPIKTPAKQALQEQIRKTIKPEPNDSDTLKVSIAAANATGDEPPTPETMHDFVEDEFLASIDLPEDPSDDELEELEDMDLDLDDLDETE